MTPHDPQAAKPDPGAAARGPDPPSAGPAEETPPAAERAGSPARPDAADAGGRTGGKDGGGGIFSARSGRPDPVTVKLARFEGPLDLLLHLIKRDEIDIYDIPIAHITQQYLAYLDLMRRLDLDIAGEFLVMAATLMRIKAKMLLPAPALGEEEEEGDPREELVQRLIEYRQFKEAAATLRLREDERRLLYERGMVPSEDEAGPLPLAPVTLFALLDALNRVMARIPEQAVYEIQGEAYDIEDKMALIASRLAEEGVLSFSALLERCRSRVEMIVTFIALLELIKLGQALVVQAEVFGDIQIVARTPEGSETHAPVESSGGD
jgi:segregation and condensation protein A